MAATPTTIPPIRPRQRNWRRWNLPRRWKQVTATILTALFILWLGFVGFIWRAMHRPPEGFAHVMSHMPWQVFLILPFETLWNRARAGTLHIGDSAPDFQLIKLDKTERVRLSELNQKQPVVMIFGSYT
jgi:hypothetical protein